MKWIWFICIISYNFTMTISAAWGHRKWTMIAFAVLAHVSLIALAAVVKKQTEAEEEKPCRGDESEEKQ